MTSNWIRFGVLGLLAPLLVPRVAPSQELFGNERRVALVIGNSAYSAKGRPLKNPANDARLMSQVLSDLKFEVITKLDAKQAEMDEAIRQFSTRLGPGAVGVFFYAGHGVQIEGLNYILPVDYDERGLDEVNLKRSSVRVDDDVVRPMEKSGARLTLVILDACRDNPYQAGRGRSAARGLAAMDPARGSAIIFGAASGQQAEDGDGANGMFTTQLVATLREPGLSLAEVSEVVIERVDKASKGQQQPAYYSQVVGRFVFNPGSRVDGVGSTPVATGRPQITVLSADRLEVEPSQSVALKVSASDPNADPLKYAWATTAGSIEGREANAIFRPGAADQQGSSVTVTVTARNSRGLETYRDVVIKVKPLRPLTPDAMRRRAYSIGPNIEVWLESPPSLGGNPSGVVEAGLETVGNVWQITSAQGNFPGIPISVTPECRNCEFLGVVEYPSSANGFKRIRLRVKPIDLKQPMGVLLRYQSQVPPKKK
jgi:hypothetical protein